MPKPEIEFLDIETNFAWRQVVGYPTGILEKILSFDQDTGEATRLLFFPPDIETSEVLIHEWWEEVLILKGDLHDIPKDRTFVGGHYACRPPGMRHGPYRSVFGCLTFEVRYLKGREAPTTN